MVRGAARRDATREKETDGDCAGGIKPARERVRDRTNQGNALSSAAS